MAKYTITYKCGHTEEMQLFSTVANKTIGSTEIIRPLSPPVCHAEYWYHR